MLQNLSSVAVVIGALLADIWIYLVPITDIWSKIIRFNWYQRPSLLTGILMFVFDSWA